MNKEEFVRRYTEEAHDKHTGPSIENVKDLLGITEKDDSWEDLDNMVHEQKACEASEVNNQGIEEQIQFLLDSGWGWSDFQSFLEQTHQ